jgi:hypothetical protein
MKLQDLKTHITKMDVKSDEFFELYNLVHDKYWHFEKPDNLQSAAQLVDIWLHRGEPKQIMIVACVVKELFMMHEKKQTACTGTLGFTDETYHFDLYTSEPERDKMHTMMREAAEAAQKGELKLGKGIRK